MFAAGGISHSDRKFLGRLEAPPINSGNFADARSSAYGDMLVSHTSGVFLGVMFHGSALRFISYVTNDRTAPSVGATIDRMDFRIVYNNYDTGAASGSLFGFSQISSLSSGQGQNNPFFDRTNPVAGLFPFKTSSLDAGSADFVSKYNIYSGEKAFFFPCITDQIIMPLRINNAGSGYTNGNYTNLSTTSTSGTGSGLKVNVRVSGGSVTALCADLETPLGLTSSSIGFDSSYSYNDVGTINGIPGGGSGAQYKIGSPLTNFGGNVRSFRMLTYLFMYQPASKAGGTLSQFGLNSFTANPFFPYS